MILYDYNTMLYMLLLFIVAASYSQCYTATFFLYATLNHSRQYN